MQLLRPTGRMSRQYTAPPELARQLIERDRQWEESEQRIYSLLSAGNIVSARPPTAPRDSTRLLQDRINEAGERGWPLVLEAGTFLIEDTLIVKSPVTIIGQNTTIRTVANNRSNFFVVTDGVEFRDLEILGNQTGLGALPTSPTGGHGIAANLADGMRIQRVRFGRVGVPTPEHANFASPIAFASSNGVTVQDCFFDSTNRNRTGADVFGYGADTAVLDNRSESYCDAFAYLYTSGGGNVRHSVRGNFATRAVDAISRSGVLYQYSGSTPVLADISHNHIEGFVWHGVYGTAEPSTAGGGVIVSHNTIRYCGGGPANLDTGTGLWYGGGIRVGGAGGATLVDNNISYSGYDSALAPRYQAASGIALQEGPGGITNAVTAIGNIIRESTGPGIVIGANGTVSHVCVLGGIVKTSVGHGIAVKSQGTNIECTTDVLIEGVDIQVTEAAASAIYMDGDNGGWGNRVNMVNNICLHTDPGASSAPGIQRDAHTAYDRNTGSVRGNTIQGFATAMQVVGIGVNLFCPRAVYVGDNRVISCALGMYVGGGSTHWGIHVNTTGAATTEMSPGRSRPGRIIGANGTATARVEMVFTGATGGVPGITPTEGTWEVGDRIMLAVPFGPVIGYRCITAGTPGSWESIYGPLWPSVARAQPRLGVTTINELGCALTVTGTAAAENWATTNVFTRSTRVAIEETVASATAVAGIRSQTLEFNRQSGYYVRLRWAPHLGQTISTGRAFAGLIQSTAAPTDVEPSSLINMIGMGWDAADTQIQMMSNDGSGTATKTALGASWPVPSADDTNEYQIELFSAINGSGVYYRVVNIVSGLSAYGTFTADQPVGNIALCGPHAYTSVGGTNGTTGLCLCDWEAWRGM